MNDTKQFCTITLKPFIGSANVVYLTDPIDIDHRKKSELIFRLDEILKLFYLPENLEAIHIELYKRQVRDSYKLSCNSWTTAGRFKFDGEPIYIFGFGRALALETFCKHKIRQAFVKVYHEEK